LAGELAGHAMGALAGYATGVPQIGDAVKKTTNKGVKSGVSMALKTEGYGMRRMRLLRTLLIQVHTARIFKPSLQ
jgi:hypothetical protein